MWITPVFPLLSAHKYFKAQFKDKEVAFKYLDKHASQDKQGRKKTIGIMVVGETARADHFSLNGYALNTNPLLKKEDIINFSNVKSCGTSTAFSVPCMFSFLDRDNYTPEKADKQSNVLDILSKVGVKVVWIDNNSSCKGVCQRIETKNICKNTDPASQYYNNDEYYDEKLLEELTPYIDNKSIDNTSSNQRDLLIVLHTMGSHGPAYHHRFPPEFAKFKPYCKKRSPHECTDEEVSNAYDNTVIYTDYILAKTIALLKQHARYYDSFLVYASDHGESLGEKGVYLHGLPYFLAPDSQTHIPFLAWFSDGFKRSHDIDMNLLSNKTDTRYSHDNLSHSLLGLFDINTALYQRDKDVFKSNSAVLANKDPKTKYLVFDDKIQ